MFNKRKNKAKHHVSEYESLNLKQKRLNKLFWWTIGVITAILWAEITYLLIRFILNY